MVKSVTITVTVRHHSKAVVKDVVHMVSIIKTMTALYFNIHSPVTLTGTSVHLILIHEIIHNHVAAA